MADVWRWVLEQNPAATETEQALKVAEEAGEVCGALLKHGPGPEVVGEMADLYLALEGLVGALGIEGEWWDIIAQRWVERTGRPIPKLTAQERWGGLAAALWSSVPAVPVDEESL